MPGQVSGAVSVASVGWVEHSATHRLANLCAEAFPAHGYARFFRAPCLLRS